MKTERMTDDPDDAVVTRLHKRVADYALAAVVVVLALAIVCGCSDKGGDNNAQTTTDNSQTTMVNNETGIVLPTNAVEVVDGVWVYQTGEGNWMQIDIQTGETTPANVAVVQTGNGNTLSVSVKPFVPPEDEEDEEDDDAS